jgi:hypothetical protein
VVTALASTRVSADTTVETLNERARIDGAEETGKTVLAFTSTAGRVAGTIVVADNRSTCRSNARTLGTSLTEGAEHTSASVDLTTSTAESSSTSAGTIRAATAVLTLDISTLGSVFSNLVFFTVRIRQILGIVKDSTIGEDLARGNRNGRHIRHHNGSLAMKSHRDSLTCANDKQDQKSHPKTVFQGHLYTLYGKQEKQRSMVSKEVVREKHTHFRDIIRMYIRFVDKAMNKSQGNMRKFNLK